MACDMPEFFQMNPDDLVEEVVEEYSCLAGHEFARTMIFVFFFGFLALASFGHPPNAPYGSEAIDSADDLYGIGLFLFIIVAAAGIGWVWRDVLGQRETGSRINLVQRKFMWWDGKKPAVVHEADIGALARITFTPNGEDDPEDVILHDSSGQSTCVPGICFKDARQWAETLKSRFPHIVVG